jgi:hypothetical protein
LRKNQRGEVGTATIFLLVHAGMQKKHGKMPVYVKKTRLDKKINKINDFFLKNRKKVIIFAPD